MVHQSKVFLRIIHVDFNCNFQMLKTYRRQLGDENNVSAFPLDVESVRQRVCCIQAQVTMAINMLLFLEKIS